MPPIRSNQNRLFGLRSNRKHSFGRGGLFSLFQNKGRSGRFHRSNRSNTSNGLLASITDILTKQNSGSISELFSGTQKALSTMLKAAPVIKQVQQVGPLIKNMPSMWKMIRMINESVQSNETSKNEVELNTVNIEEQANSKPSKEVLNKETILKQSKVENTQINKAPLPKLYLKKDSQNGA